MSVRHVDTDPHFQSIGQASAGVVAKLAQNQADPWAYWSKALTIGNGRQLTRDQMRDMAATTEPQLGFYRMRNKGGKDKAVAVGLIGKVLTAWIDGSTMRQNGDPIRPEDIWTYCCSWPISHEQYEAVTERGEPWPDDGPARNIGDNLSDDPHEAAKVEFEGEKEAAEEILAKPIKMQADADRAAVQSKKLADIHGRVDKMFRAEKDPIVVAGREVDEKFRWREDAKALSVKLKRAQDDFLNEQRRLEEKRQREAKIEADRLQREADEKARKAEAEAKRASPEEQERLKREADEAAAKAAAKEREAREQKVYAGRTGAKTSLREFVDAEIVDYPALVIALQDRAEMKELVQSLANRAARAGVELAGMKVRKEMRAA